MPKTQNIICQVSTTFAITAISLLTPAVSTLARPASITAQEQNASVNVRSAPDTYAKIVTSGKPGTPIEVLRQVAPPDQDYAWVYAKVGKSTGWIHAEYIEYNSEDKTYGTLYGQSLDARINVRSAPSIQGKILQEGLPGDMVQVLRTLKGDGGYQWHSIQYADGSKGWVREDLIIIWED
jgi:SH3-like domain-containing protein